MPSRIVMEFGSISRNLLVSNWRRHLYQEAFRYSDNDWVRMLQLIEGVNVQCVTPIGLFMELRWYAEEVDALIIGADGSGDVILSSLLALSGFKPVFIQWEPSSRNSTTIAMRLAARGYAIFRQDKDLIALDSSTGHLHMLK